MKLILTLLAAATLTGCATFDELVRVTNSNLPWQTGSYNERYYNRDAYSDRYYQGYRGYYDTRNRKIYYSR